MHNIFNNYSQRNSRITSRFSFARFGEQKFREQFRQLASLFQYLRDRIGGFKESPGKEKGAGAKKKRSDIFNTWRKLKQPGAGRSTFSTGENSEDQKTVERAARGRAQKGEQGVATPLISGALSYALSSSSHARVLQPTWGGHLRQVLRSRVENATSCTL